MKKISMTMAIFLTITGFLFVDSAFAGRVGKGQVNQQKRIHQGAKSGELTKMEFKRLEREQAKLQKGKKRALSDGKLTQKKESDLSTNRIKPAVTFTAPNITTTIAIKLKMSSKPRQVLPECSMHIDPSGGYPRGQGCIAHSGRGSKIIQAAIQIIFFY